jgi:hypothetical protein
MSSATPSPNYCAPSGIRHVARDESAAPAVILYRAFDAAGLLLYVGISNDVFLRLGNHTAASAWVTHATTITLERHNNRESAVAAECCAIRGEDPVWNMQGRPLDRFMRWMIAYPGRHADDVSDAELAEVIRQTAAAAEEYSRTVEEMRTAAILKGCPYTVIEETAP